MRLLNRSQAAARLGVPERAIYSLTRSGHLPALRVGRVYRYEPAALDAWLGHRAANAIEVEPSMIGPANTDEVTGETERLLAALLAEQREVRRLLVRLGNRLAGASR